MKPHGNMMKNHYRKPGNLEPTHHLWTTDNTSLLYSIWQIHLKKKKSLGEWDLKWCNWVSKHDSLTNILWIKAFFIFQMRSLPGLRWQETCPWSEIILTPLNKQLSAVFMSKGKQISATLCLYDWRNLIAPYSVFLYSLFWFKMYFCRFMVVEINCGSAACKRSQVSFGTHVNLVDRSLYLRSAVIVLAPGLCSLNAVRESDKKTHQ